MSRIRLLTLAVLTAALFTLPGTSQTPSSKGKFAPRLVPVAETKLLMEGLAHPNFQGAKNILRAEKIEKEDWTFVRGQALIIAETGNLLMLRPPNNTGQDAW